MTACSHLGRPSSPERSWSSARMATNASRNPGGSESRMAKTCLVYQTPVTSGIAGSLGTVPGSQAPSTQTYPEGHSTSQVAVRSPRTVTAKYTPSPPAVENAAASKPGSTAPASRNACASPAALVVARADLPPSLPRVDRAAAGTEKRMVSPAMGAPVSASISRTRSGADPDADTSKVAVCPPSSTSVPGPGAMRRSLRTGTTSTVKLTCGASNAGALATTSALPVPAPAVNASVATPPAPVVASCDPEV